jgi:hypothetical protein
MYVQERLFGENVPLPAVAYWPVSTFSDDYPAVRGVYGQFLLAHRKGEVLEDVAITVGDWYYSPSALARAIVRARRGRWPDSDVQREIEDLIPPVYALPGCWGDCALVDIRRAYASILERWGVREMRPLRYFSRTPAWMPPARYWSGAGEDLVLRVLPSVARSGKMRVWWARDRIEERERWCLDPRPWGVVVTVLSGIAELARRDFGCVYWNVDGGILPAEHVDDFLRLIRALGLDARVQAQGETMVLGIGAYRVGGKASIPYQRGVRGAIRVGGGAFAQWAALVVSREVAS